MEQSKEKRPGAFRFYLLNILLCTVIAVVLAVMGVIFLCPVRDVRVKGSTVYLNEQIEEMILDDKYDRNAVYAMLRNRIMPKRGIPFIASYAVSMADRSTLVITIKEKPLYGCLFGGSEEEYVYFDEEGNVLEISPMRVKGVFFINGFTAKDAEAGSPLPIGKSNIKTVLTLEKELFAAEIPVKKVTFSEEGTITFKIKKKILVNLGTRVYLVEKLRRLPYILPELDGQRGTLHLEGWSEENTDVVFEKKE